MASFITDRTQADVDATLALIEKVRTTAWSELTPEEQYTYMSIDTLYEDRGRFSKASADRISSYMKEITDKMLTDSPPTLPDTVDGRTIGAWGLRDFTVDADFPSSEAFRAISRDDFQYWVDILTVAYGGNPTGWNPYASPYLNFETLNILEEKSEGILAGTITTIVEYTGTYYTGDEVFLFDEPIA